MTVLAAIVAPTGDVVRESVPLNAISDEWDADWIDLAAHASEPNPFNESWFLRTAVAHFGTHRDDRMIAVWNKGTLIGMLPVTTAPRYGRMPIRHVENWTHYHCFFGTPLVRAGSETGFWQSVLALLDGDKAAESFLHLVGLDPSGPVYKSLCAVRRTDIVHRSERAMLSSDLGPRAYYEANVRPKKRKEIRRLQTRLAELGTIAFEQLTDDAPIDAWIAQFLALEASGWKGREGTALVSDNATRQFFEQAVGGAHRTRKLDMLRLTLDGKPIAMLVNFIAPPGAFAFKIAFDENYARFSPGVLIKIENLKTLDRTDVDWTDSCAVEDHPMINSLWAERRALVRVTVPLAGRRRKLIFHAARAAETAAATLRGRS